FPGDAMDLADVISAQTQINRRLHEIKTLEAEVTHWKKLCSCFTQGPNTINKETVWKLKSHIRDLEWQRMQELDEHQLEVAVLQNVHLQKLADLTDQHHKQLMDYQRQVENLQNQHSAGNVNRDLLQEREMELRRLKQQLTQMQRLNDSLNNIASDLRAEEQKQLTEWVREQDVYIEELRERPELQEEFARTGVEQLQRQLQECALKSEQVLVVLNEKMRENSNLKRDYHEMTDRLTAKEADLQRVQEENQKLSTRVESSSQEGCRERIRDLSHVLQEEVEELRKSGEELLSSQEKLCGQLSENELLSQAVTNLKERIADFEMDMCWLKEENAKIMKEVHQLHEEGRHCDRRLVNLKLELAKWMEKADTLEGKLKSLQRLLHQTNADLEVKEDQLQEFKKQNEVQQEILEDTQKKLMTLVSQSEGMVDKILLRRLFVG
uniref:Uncharacterized protein n=1 Tax=Mustela putorius furo TaxID=9669 RepID=M3YM13_MUSPF